MARFALAGVLLFHAARAWAIGEVITDIKIQNNARTLEETVRTISGINIGEVLEVDTLDKVRQRLHTTGLFSDVNVYWEPHRDGVRVVIAVKDKFPWAPVPTFSLSAGNTSAGLIIGHGNLFGRGKRGVIGGRYSNVDSGALVAYDDPALFGSWMFWTLKGRIQDQVMPEFSNLPDLPIQAIRESNLRAIGGDINVGVAWFRKVRTSVGWFVDRNQVRSSRVVDSNPYAPPGLPAPMADDRPVVRGAATTNLTFDFRGREHSIVYGNALSFTFDYASPSFGGDENIEYWKVGASYEQGIRFFRRHNLVLRVAGTLGDKLPFFAESSTSGTNLRGFVYRQYLGDTHLRSQVEYHFPLFSLGPVDVRGLFFNDGAAIWYRKLPPEFGNEYEALENGRRFLPPSLLVPGFDLHRDAHTSFGGGVRFFLKSVAVPLVGFDVAHGIDTGTVRFILVIGA